jgi:hypothetical protein
MRMNSRARNRTCLRSRQRHHRSTSAAGGRKIPVSAHAALSCAAAGSNGFAALGIIQ